jgi:tRNA pseudouridine55 synthase
MFGILNLNKPVGYTSRDAVNRIQWLIRPVKVGHAGTLDPLAHGVLVLCLGPATRLIEKVQQMPKTYRGTFRLGCHSITDDTEGELVPLPSAIRPTHAAILAALEEFIGQIQQRPPAYSAIKIGGKRAYHLARRGQSVSLPPRPVTIHSIAIDYYQYPELVLDIVCGSGTYIRSLGRDLAEAVGTAAVMTGLIRTAIGPYAIDQALDPQSVSHGQLAKCLQSPLTALGDMPRVQLTDSQIADVQHGRFILHDSAEDLESAKGLESAKKRASSHKEPRLKSTTEIAALDSDNHLVALLVPKPGNRWGPSRNFPLPG